MNNFYFYPNNNGPNNNGDNNNGLHHNNGHACEPIDCDLNLLTNKITFCPPQSSCENRAKLQQVSYDNYIENKIKHQDDMQNYLTQRVKKMDEYQKQAPITTAGSGVKFLRWHPPG